MVPVSYTHLDVYKRQVENLILAKGQFSIIMGIILYQIDHHFCDWNDSSEIFIVNNCDQTAGFRSFNSAEHTSQNLSGTVCILDLMPDQVRL